MQLPKMPIQQNFPRYKNCTTSGDPGNKMPKVKFEKGTSCFNLIFLPNIANF
jgi:hypothetical protein